MASLTSVLSAAYISRNQFNDWLGLMRRPRVLQTEYIPTDRVVSRELSRTNARELAFVGALTRGGINLSKAVETASEWLADIVGIEATPYYAISGVNGEGLRFSDPSLGLLDLSMALSGSEGGWAEAEHDRSVPVREIYIVDRAATLKCVDGLCDEPS